MINKEVLEERSRKEKTNCVFRTRSTKPVKYS